MIGCLRTRVRKQPIIPLYFESENEIKFYNLRAWFTFTLQANEMIGNIRNAFNELINDLDWMDEETKNLAREKVAYSIQRGSYTSDHFILNFLNEPLANLINFNTVND